MSTTIDLTNFAELLENPCVVAYTHNICNPLTQISAVPLKLPQRPRQLTSTALADTERKNEATEIGLQPWSTIARKGALWLQSNRASPQHMSRIEGYRATAWTWIAFSELLPHAQDPQQLTCANEAAAYDHAIAAVLFPPADAQSPWLGCHIASCKLPMGIKGLPTLLLCLQMLADIGS